MTQDEIIIAMAREAGLKLIEDCCDVPEKFCAADVWKGSLSSFAALVAAHEREKQAEQEPVAWRVRGYNKFKTGNPALWRYVDGADKPAVNKPDCCDFEQLYTHPVRTKDLTVSELDAIIEKHYDDEMDLKAMILDGIAADREKNK